MPKVEIVNDKCGFVTQKLRNLMTLFGIRHHGS